MKDLFYYAFYRASKFYKSWGENNNYYISGKFSLFLAFASNILFLIGLFCYILGIRYSIQIVYLIWILLFVLSFFVLNENRYKELAEKYKFMMSCRFASVFMFYKYKYFFYSDFRNRQKRCE